MTLGGVGERAVIAFRQERVLTFGIRSARYFGRKIASVSIASKCTAGAYRERYSGDTTA